MWNDDEVVVHWRCDFDAQRLRRVGELRVTRSASCSAREAVEMAPEEDDARFWTAGRINASGFLAAVTAIWRVG